MVQIGNIRFVHFFWPSLLRRLLDRSSFCMLVVGTLAHFILCASMTNGRKNKEKYVTPNKSLFLSSSSCLILLGIHLFERMNWGFVASSFL